MGQLKWQLRRDRDLFGDGFACALAHQRAEPLLFKGEAFARTDIAPALKT